MSPLYQLLHKSRRWQWGKDQDRVFTEAKLLLKSPRLLTHYDCSKHLTLACDASPYGVGAVLSHKFDDDDEKPIAYVSRTLNKTESKYAQIDKESLAIIFGITKFRKYLVGRKFTIYTDHKPLMYIFGENSMTASTRVTRWALLLSGYEYSVQYKPGKELANADGLSRLPLSDIGQEDATSTELINLIEHLNSTPISVSESIKCTSRNATLLRVRHLIRHGWPENIDGDIDLKPYVRHKLEVSVLDNCILFGSRVVVSPHCRKTVLDEHQCHPGVSRVKALARPYVWWPKMDTDIESKVRECHVCQSNRNSPAPAPLHSWEYPTNPWSRIHVDHAGPVLGHTLLIVMDAYSKWIDAMPVNSTSSAETIEKLRHLFSNFGVLDKVVSDNGTSFSSREF